MGSCTSAAENIVDMEIITDITNAVNDLDDIIGDGDGKFDMNDIINIAERIEALVALNTNIKQYDSESQKQIKKLDRLVVRKLKKRNPLFTKIVSVSAPSRPGSEPCSDGGRPTGLGTVRSSA